MQKHNLPERIEHLLPDEAETVDRASRVLVEHLQGFGYRLVMPPLAESLDTLLDGDSGDSLGERTLRLTDPLGGEPIGIRADITPQVARIDERHFNAGVNRLCYCGSALYSRPVKPWLNREHLQVGAEIYGCEPLSSASEIIMVAIGALSKVGVKDIGIALGHAGIVNEALASVPEDVSGRLRRLLQRKDATSVRELVDDKAYASLKELMSMHSDASMLKEWQDVLPQSEQVRTAFKQLEEIAGLLDKCGIRCTLDLTGLTGYEYHNGVAFAILGGESLLARGGHYGTPDRPGCGFSVNVRQFIGVVPEAAEREQFASLRSFEDPAWRDKVEELVDKGMRCLLVDDWQQVPDDCQQRLHNEDGSWRMVDSGK